MHRASHPYGRSCTQAKAEAVRWCSSANANRRPCPSTAALAPPHKYLCSMVNDISLLLRSTAPAFCQQRHDACSFARRVVAIPYSRRPLHISASPHTHIRHTTHVRMRTVCAHRTATAAHTNRRAASRKGAAFAGTQKSRPRNPRRTSCRIMIPRIANRKINCNQHLTRLEHQ